MNKKLRRHCRVAGRYSVYHETVVWKLKVGQMCKNKWLQENISPRFCGNITIYCIMKSTTKVKYRVLCISLFAAHEDRKTVDVEMVDSYIYLQIKSYAVEIFLQY